MQETKLIMGMPITVEIVNNGNSNESVKSVMKKVFTYFKSIDERFSPFKPKSEVTLINKGKVDKKEYSPFMNKVLKLSEETKDKTNGYFDIYYSGILNPSGLVKGWAIYEASKIIKDSNFNNFFINAGGDIQAEGKNSKDLPWKVGIRNPFNKNQIIKVLEISGKGVATSGTYERGKHIINPKSGKRVDEIVSVTVVGPNVYEADRFATAAFAMGTKGIYFIQTISGLEGYMIDKNGIATYTKNFSKYFRN